MIRGMMLSRRATPFLLCLLLSAGRLASADKQQTWMEVRSPHFAVVTNGNEKQAHRVADQFEQIRAIFEKTLKVRVDPGKPFTILALKDENTMRTMMPEFWERKGLVHPSGYFIPGNDKHYAVVRLDVTGENPYHTVYHEYVHMVLNLNFRALPLWVNEGLAEFYGNSVLGDKEVGLGKPDSRSILRLRDQRLLPFDDLFQVTHGSPHYSEANRATIFYAESWALVHCLVLGEKRQGGQGSRLGQFLKLLQKGVDEEQAAEQVFGDLRKLEKTIEGYLRQNAFPYVRAPSPASTKPDEFPSRVLGGAESTALLGDFHLHDHRPKDAQPLLEEALRLDPKLAAARESMGFLHFQQGNQAEAAKWFEGAVEADSRSFLAHYYHAMLAVNGFGDAAALDAAEKSLALTAARGKVMPGFSVCSHVRDLSVTIRYKVSAAGAGELLAIECLDVRPAGLAGGLIGDQLFHGQPAPVSMGLGMWRSACAAAVDAAGKA